MKRLVTPGSARALPIAITLALASAGAAHGATYDLDSDFSNASNPNGAWSFTYGGNPLAHYPQPSTPNALNGAAANGYWGTGADFFTVPFVLQATANGSSVGYTNNDFLAGDVLVHGPNDGSAVSVNWTAPGAGLIDFTSSIWYAHSIVTRSQVVEAFLNGQSLGSVTVTNSNTRANPFTSLNGNGIAVGANDVLSFQFTKSAGQQYGSVDGIDAIINFSPTLVGAVPEPATWAMMILGFGVLGASMRRRQHSLAFAG